MFIFIMKFIFSLYREAFSNLQRNIWILSIAMFINRSGSMVLLFTSLYLTKELNFSMAEAGVMMSFYGIGSVIGSYAGGWLTDRKNYFDIMLFSLISSGLILLLMLLATSASAIAAIIFFYAFCADMFRPAINPPMAGPKVNPKLIANLTNETERVRFPGSEYTAIAAAFAGLNISAVKA